MRGRRGGEIRGQLEGSSGERVRVWGGAGYCMYEGRVGEEESRSNKRAEEAALSFIITLLIYSQRGRSALWLSIRMLW